MILYDWGCDLTVMLSPHSRLVSVRTNQSHSTFGRSGHTKSQRLCSPVASRFGQSALSITPFHQIAPAAVLRDQLRHAVASLAVAPSAFDSQHVELAVDVAEDELAAGHGEP